MSNDNNRFINFTAKSKKKRNFEHTKMNHKEFTKDKFLHTNRQKKEKTDIDRVSVSLWMNTSTLGDKTLLLKCVLSEHGYFPGGKIGKLWECIHFEMQRIKENEYKYKDGFGLRTFICERYSTKRDDNVLVMSLCDIYEINLLIISLNKEFSPIEYGKSKSNGIQLVHIGYKNFMPIKKEGSNEIYIMSDEDNEILKNVDSAISKRNGELNEKTEKLRIKEISLIKELTELVQGKERAQDDFYYFPRNSTRKQYYDVIDIEKLVNKKDLKECKLHIKNAHVATASIIGKNNSKDGDIQLLNRKNCGFNAFEGDTVYVEINDKKNRTGRVLGVKNSFHKPVNSIYLCKVCRDQGSHMSPIDGSFPKILVYNQPGRNQYALDLKKKKREKIKEEQKTDDMRRREGSRYADNLYVTIHKVEFKGNSRSPEFTAIRTERFDPETCDKLFLVFYEFWDICMMYPSGRVVGMISTYDSFKDSLHLMLPLCNIEQLVIDKPYKKEMKEIERKVKKVTEIPVDVVPKGAMVFTIDNEDTRDMDDALSYHVRDDLIVVGVHITNITKYISVKKDIFKQAKRRFATAYIPKELQVDPIYVIEKSLSTDFFSLMPNENRAVVSVMFHFKKVPPYTLVKVTFAETFIRSKYKLSYRKVEKWLKASERPIQIEEDLYIAIKACYNIANSLRRTRLPDSYFVRQSNYRRFDFDFDDYFNARCLIEEFMLLANENVAKKIYKSYPDMGLLRVQEPVSDYDEWHKRLTTFSNTDLRSSLTQCCNLLNIRNDVVVNGHSRPLTVSLRYYDDFVRFVDNGDVNRARNMLQYDEYINDFYVHLSEWYGISSPARYNCSIENCVDNRHFSLDKNLYTHFTSPIRRFPDIIVHLLLRSIINPSVSLDSIDQRSIDEVCTIANKRLKSNANFEKHCVPYVIFETSPTTYNFVLDCACSKFTNDELHFIHPSLQRASSKNTIKFSQLSLSQSPVNIKDGNQPMSCDLHWKRIIYSTKAVYTPKPISYFLIDNRLYDAVLPVSKNHLFDNIRSASEPIEGLEEDLKELCRAFSVKKADGIISSDSLANPIIDIHLKLSLKNTIRIQFCSYKYNGLKRVTPELFIVHPSLQLCLIHQEDPVMCFVSGGKLVINNDIMWKFETINEYHDYFTPLIQLESLKAIMREKCKYTWVDVKIHWMKAMSEMTRKEEVIGIINYDQAICEARHVDLGEEDEEIETLFSDIIKESLSSVNGDLICIRGKMKNGYNYWVGHGATVNVCKYQLGDKDPVVKMVVFMLTQSDFDVFDDDDMTFVVDMYEQSVATRRQLIAIRSISKDKFLKEIVFGRESNKIDIDPGFLKKVFESLSIMNVPTPNRRQKIAIEMALKNKFSLIWGPPGTGKTSIGCILAFCFGRKNGDNGVILYCGPSNESVNIILKAMTEKFKTDCPKMLRIFSKKQELADFPLPGHTTNCAPLPERLHKYCLHFLLRTLTSADCRRLLELDTKFKSIMTNSKMVRTDIIDGKSVHEYIREYKVLLKKLKEDYINQNHCNMVLTTTSVGGSQIMGQFKVKQIIVDEAGMCEEPETLIPIVKAIRSVENVVLIGDHKQLRPIIIDDLASRRGLQISLFERYQALRPKMVTLLDEQYRMHPSICEFPSNYFYRDKLKTKPSPKWSGLEKNHFQDDHDYETWNGVDYDQAVPEYENYLTLSGYNAVLDWPGIRMSKYPCFSGIFEFCAERVVFINIIGDEIVESVSTNTCSENSRANLIEVMAVANLYGRLIARMKNNVVNAPDHITVLTQYRLQESFLLEECKRTLSILGITTDPIIRTVIKSQGSENDYVFFSTVRSLRNKADIIDNPTPGWENKYLGFITDPNQVNVALTRAQKGLIIIGNKSLLSVNVMWKQLLLNLTQRGCVIEWKGGLCDNFLNNF